MKERFFTQQSANGMTLLGQHMPQVSSAAMTLLLPAGAAHDPEGCEGAAAVAAEWCFRGAGDRDTRQLHDALDALGAQHQQGILSEHLQLTSSQLGRNLAAVVGIFAEVVRRPRLDDETFDPCRDLTLQDLAALEDEPMRKCNLLLREKFYPHPLGRGIYGTADSLQAMTPEALRAYVRRGFQPRGAILAVAGNVQWDAFCDAAESCFGDWAPGPEGQVAATPAVGGVTFIQKPSAQAHLAIAHRSVTAGDDHYYAARMAEIVLSGGMSGRLFTEVREKRGLVYSVGSRYHSLKDHAGIFTYAGTRPEVAQETFDVVVGELRRLAEGITPEELQRGKTQLKSSLVMRGESTGARAAALAGDWYHLGRLRGLEEISREVDAITAEQVFEHLRAYPAENFTVLVIAPEPIDAGAMNEK